MTDVVGAQTHKLPAQQFATEPPAIAVILAALDAMGNARDHDRMWLTRAAAALTQFIEIGGIRMIEIAREWAARTRERATRREIAIHLAMLCGAWPNAQAKDLAIFGGLLAQDVEALHPSVYALERAAAKLRRESTFLPMISEIVAAIEAEEYYGRRVDERLNDRSRTADLLDLEGRLELIHARLAELAALDAVYNARRPAKPFCA